MTSDANLSAADSSADRPTVSYADAGVDLDAADKSVELLSGVLERASRPEVIGGIGGFGGMFAFDPSKYEEPVLVSGTDGVGTKVDLARRMGKLDTVGIDLVAMVVDDLVVSGAEPLFFNDYVSVGKLDPERVADLVRGIAEGCAQSNCALVGGETAEHPGLLADDEFDLAGFGVAVVERGAMLGQHLVNEGDVVIAMASSGVHSNGYSLVRAVIGDRDLDQTHGLSRSLGAALLEPTRIYALDCLALRDELGTGLHALCHVTGGGLPGNLPRVLPDHLGAHLDPASYTWPEVFTWLEANGPVARDEMWRTFNCGVGMVAIVAAADADRAIALLGERGLEAWNLGSITAHDPAGDTPRVTGLASAGEVSALR